MRQSTALHATRRNQVSAVVRQAKHYCVDRDADLHDVVADPPRLPGWERVVGDGRHLPEERPAVLDQPVSNPLAFSGSPHATLRFPKLPRRGCETRSEEHTSELQSRLHLVCRLLLEKKKQIKKIHISVYIVCGGV